MRVGIALPVGEDPERGGAALPSASCASCASWRYWRRRPALISIWLADHLFYQPPDGGRPLGPAEPFWQRRGALYGAAAQVGRDPAEIEITVGLIVSDEAALAANADRSRTLLGGAEQIAEGLTAWRHEGVAEVMCVLEPPTPAMVERLARATDQLRPSPAALEG